MKRIAIVGNIGSGKSFVAKNIKFPIFDADREVDKIYKKNKFCFRKLKKALPKYVHSFPINKVNITNAKLKKADENNYLFYFIASEKDMYDSSKTNNNKIWYRIKILEDRIFVKKLLLLEYQIIRDVPIIGKSR